MATQQQRREATIASIVASARMLFARDGYEPTSIDDIAVQASVAKGAVYHHFSSKAQLFTAVLDQVQGDTAHAILRAARGGSTPAEAILGGTRAFLIASLQPEPRRIVLTDGPVVLGWKKWREIDEKHFGQLLLASLRGAFGPRADAAQLSVACHLLLGAITEAALACSVAAKPRAEVDRYMSVLEQMVRAALKV